MRRTVCLLAASLLIAVLLPAPAGASGTVVLGSAEFAKPAGEGWGTAHPARIFNGGDPSGLVKEIQWTTWGAKTAVGYGLGWISNPAGGYYGRPVLVELRAENLGRCGSRRAYTRLEIRAPPQPEASLGPWRLWSEAKSICKPAV